MHKNPIIQNASVLIIALQKGNQYFKRGTGVLNNKNTSDFFGFYLRHIAILAPICTLFVPGSDDYVKSC